MLRLRHAAFVVYVGLLSMLAACGGGGYNGSSNNAAAVVAPTALSYTTPATATIGVAASGITPTVTGKVTSYTVTPALPAGLILDAATGAITGTATSLSDAANYTITATNSAGSTTFVLSLAVKPSAATAFTQSNLVSDGTVAGTRNDAKLVNPWGLVFATGAPAWVADNGSQASTLYDGTGTALALVVNIPAGTRGAADPTGIVANATTDFVVTKNSITAPARFIFAGEAGTISGWSPTVDGTNAITVYDDSAGAVYTGLAIATNAGANTLYAADFGTHKIDVFDGHFQKITATGGFADSTLPAGYSPFNIQAVTLGDASVLVVTYANQTAGSTDEAVGAGLGIVNLFDLNGTLIRHLVPAGGRLNAPWGVAKAPATFGSLANMLLIGNFGDGVINGFDPTTGVFAGSVSDAAGNALANVGLWGIGFGNGAQNQPVNTLYFAAGIAGETAGLYGRIDLGATAPDATAPTVALTAPAAGALSGTVSLTATAADNAAVAQVNFLLRSGTTTTTLGSDTTAPYSFDLNTTTLTNGAFTLLAQAVDSAGNATTSAPVAVTVSNVAAATVTLADLQTTIFTPKCSSCHTGGGASLPGIMNLSSTSATFASLVNVTSIEVPALNRVKAGDPASSYIINKLEGTQTVGARMPFGGTPLDQATIDRVKAWIQAGAAQ
jgi:uncharacterized protein (TIGR03118 family)